MGKFIDDYILVSVCFASGVVYWLFTFMFSWWSGLFMALLNLELRSWASVVFSLLVHQIISIFGGLLNGRRSQWPRVLRRASAAARLLGLWVRIPPVAWMFVCCDFCVLSVAVCTSGWSLVQRTPTECGVSKWAWQWSLGKEEALAH